MSYDFGVDVLGAGPSFNMPALTAPSLSPSTSAPSALDALRATQNADRQYILDGKQVTKEEFDRSVQASWDKSRREWDAGALRTQQKKDADVRMARNIFVGGVIGGTIGSLALGAGGAYLWPAHRILGFFLGSFVGWPMGSTVGGTIGATR